MGLLQPYVGHGRGHGETHLTDFGKAVTVTSLLQAKAALAAAESLDVPVTLLSAPDAAASVGPGWFDALVAQARVAYPTVRMNAVLDCGDAPGYALSALRHGFKIVRYSGLKQNEIEEIAQGYDATVLQDRPDSLELKFDEDSGAIIEAMCKEWLTQAA